MNRPGLRLSLRLTLLFLTLVLPGLATAKPDKAKPAPAAPPPSFIEPHYYFNLDLDPRYQIVGVGEMSKEDAEQADCYRFIYNESGKLKQVQYQRAGTPVSDPIFGVARINFDYEPQVERRGYYDSHGLLTTNVDGIAAEELKLNPAGFPIEVANLDAAGNRTRDGQGVIRYVRTLDAQNRLVTGRRIGLLGNAITDNSGYFETRSLYDDLGHRVERGNYDDSGKLLNDDDGVALVRTSYTIYPDTTQITESYFDATELAVEDKSTGAHEVQRVNDRRGFLLSEAYFDITGTPCYDLQGGIHERRYTYDDRGNVVSEAFFDVDEKPADRRGPLFGYARVAYKYDNKNRVIEKAYLGDDGAPAIVPDSGAAIVRQEYDDQGNIVHQMFFDGQGRPTPSSVYGAPAIRIAVEGDHTTVRLMDENDKLMKNPIKGYASFSYKTATDIPLSPTNHYYNRHGRTLAYFPRVAVINPHLYALKNNATMRYSAWGGATAAGIGALIACLLALRKSFHTRRRKVYVPRAFERFLGWFAVLAMVEGILRFFLTVYWWWLNHQNGRMGYPIYIVEIIILTFFCYRLFRLKVTMRVLNIEREDIHRIVREFLLKANLKPEWTEASQSYLTPPLDTRIRFFKQKFHAYLAFDSRGEDGDSLARGMHRYIREQVKTIHAPLPSRTIKIYYRCVALAYFLLSGTAFYTLWQMVKGS